MTLDEVLENDIIAAGDIFAVPGRSWLEKFENPETPYSHVGMFINKDTFLDSKPRRGTIVSPVSDLPNEFIIIKTGLRFDRRMPLFVRGICTPPLCKYSRLNAFMAVFNKNNPYKLFSSALVGTVLVNHGYHLKIKGLTPSRLVQALTSFYGRKIIRVTNVKNV